MRCTGPVLRQRRKVILRRVPPIVSKAIDRMRDVEHVQDRIARGIVDRDPDFESAAGRGYRFGLRHHFLQ